MIVKTDEPCASESDPAVPGQEGVQAAEDRGQVGGAPEEAQHGPREQDHQPPAETHREQELEQGVYGAENGARDDGAGSGMDFLNMLCLFHTTFQPNEGVRWIMELFIGAPVEWLVG